MVTVSYFGIFVSALLGYIVCDLLIKGPFGKLLDKLLKKDKEEKNHG